MHLPAALSDNAHDERMRYSRANFEAALIQFLQLFVVFLLCVHLDFQGVYFEELSA